jgi:hypothetical protein
MTPSAPRSGPERRQSSAGKPIITKLDEAATPASVRPDGVSRGSALHAHSDKAVFVVKSAEASDGAFG